MAKRVPQPPPKTPPVAREDIPRKGVRVYVQGETVPREYAQATGWQFTPGDSLALNYTDLIRRPDGSVEAQAACMIAIRHWTQVEWIEMKRKET